MKTGIILLIIAFILSLFIGVKYHPEFHEPTFFWKHRPTFKLNYNSPIGDSGRALDKLTGKKKQEELDFREFVGDYFENDFLDHFAVPVIPLISSLIGIGFFLIFQLIKKKFWHIAGLPATISYGVLCFLSIAILNKSLT